MARSQRSSLSRYVSLSPGLCLALHCFCPGGFEGSHTAGTMFLSGGLRVSVTRVSVALRISLAVRSEEAFFMRGCKVTSEYPISSSL